jgi:hypothetical protein
MGKPTFKPGDPKEEEVDRLLGKGALFKMRWVTEMGGPSVPTLQRARRQGLLEVVKNGARTDLPRAEVKRIFLKGLGPISFLYGKGAKESA